MADPPEMTSALEALSAAYNWQASPEVRQAAVNYLEQLKSGEFRKVATLAFSLVQGNRPSEVKVFAYQLLQHLVRARWKEFSAEEEHSLAQLAFKLLQDSATPTEPWSLKSKSASFLADVVKRHGPDLWREILPGLLASAAASPSHSELAALVLQFVAEDITIHNEDLEGYRRRPLLVALTSSLPQVLPFLYRLLDENFSAAMASVQQGNMEAAKAHAAVVSAALSALGAHAEWAAVGDFASYNLIDACGYLLQATEFRISACDFLKQVAARRRSPDDAAVFDAAMTRVFDALTASSLAILQNIGPTSEAASEADLEFAEKLCEGLVIMTPTNVKRVVAGSKERLAKFLQEILGFLQHGSFALHSQALALWLTLLRDSTIISPSGAGPVGPISASPHVANGSHGVTVSLAKRKGKKGDDGDEPHAIVIPMEVVSALLDVVARRLPRRGAECEDEDLAADLSSPAELMAYRSRLFELMRLLTAQQPLLAASKVMPRVDAAISAAISGPVNQQVLAMLDSAQWLADAMMGAIPHATMAAALAAATSAGASGSSPEYQLGFLIEGLVSKLLALEWQGAALVEQHAHFLDAMGPYFKHSPPSTPRALPKLFSLLMSLPIQMPPGSSYRAQNHQLLQSRLRICLSILRVSRAADIALVPYLQGMAEQVQQMQQQKQLLQSELTQLAEALLVIGGAAGPQQQANVMEWLLSPVRNQWTDPKWQHLCLSEATSLARVLTTPPENLNPGGTDSVWGGGDGVWWIFYTIALFEKSVSRSTKLRASPPSQASREGSGSLPGDMHPAAAHLGWMLPPLLQLLRCLHTLWAPTVRPHLPPVLRSAIQMSAEEKAALLGDLGGRMGPPAEPMGERREPLNEAAESKEAELHKWLKGMRETAYSFLGLAATRASKSFFEDPASDDRAAHIWQALLENLHGMEPRHIRLMIRIVVIPFAKACPTDRWPFWIGSALGPLLAHVQGLLREGWTNTLQRGSVQPQESDTKGSGGAIKEEVLEEKLLRDLTREVCSLLALLPCVPPEQQNLASANQGAAGLDQGRAEGQTQEDTEQQMMADQRRQQPQRETLLSFVMQRPDLAQIALPLGTEALSWPDGESLKKALFFCTAVAALPGLTDSSAAQLREFVGRDLFLAAIQSLTLVSSANYQAEILGLLREIYLRLSPLSSGPRELLLSLPSIMPPALAEFDSALGKTGSAREQRQLIKQLLMQGAGTEQLKAFLGARGPVAITNLSSTARSGGSKPPQGGFQFQQHEHGPIGLASMGV